VDLTPAETDPVTGKVTYPFILAPPVDPGVAAICEHLVPLLARNPGLNTDPRGLASALHRAVREMYTVRTAAGHELHTGPVAGDTIRKDDEGLWTTQLPEHSCSVRPGEVGDGAETYVNPEMTVRMTVHGKGCGAWAEVTLTPAS
jgi:hypothetical protein